MNGWMGGELNGRMDGWAMEIAQLFSVDTWYMRPLRLGSRR